jgi:hypothetical protein
MEYVLSDFFDVLSGVPQGSVLSLKLFLLCTADIPGLFLSPCAMFPVDDIYIYIYIYRYIFIAKTSVILAGAQASTTPDAHIKN